MNIFYLDTNPVVCAVYHCDKHVVKMVLEYAQILSTVHHLRETDVAQYVYKATHVNHPCVLWANESKVNYAILLVLFHFLSSEYTHRYYKIHKSYGLYEHLMHVPEALPLGEGGMTPLPMCMPDAYRNDNGDVVEAYRAYYCGDKARFAKWTNRNVPYWFHQIGVDRDSVTLDKS